MQNIFFAALLLLWLPLHAFSASIDRKQSVLIIHSYHKEMQWVDEMQRSIEQTLLDSLGTAIDIKVEFMDSKRYDNSEYYQLLASIWRYKYLNNKPDCLIISDDNALNLILTFRDELFKDIPIVFCGINFYDSKRFSQIDNITGVIEAYDLPGTLNIIKKLHPDKKNLFIINDSTTTGAANKARLEEIAYDFSDHFTFIYSGNLAIDTLKTSVQKLTEDSVILLMSFNKDAEGTILRYRDAIEVIRNSSVNPIFGVWSFYLGRGIVGGSLVNGLSQGQKAAEIALRILNGATASSLPVITTSPNLPMFDYRELQRFSIPDSLLPAGSIITNTPDTIWYQHKYKLLAAITLLIGQLFIITLLVHNIRKRKASEKMLLKNRQNLAITLEAIGEAVISVNTHYEIVRSNQPAAALLGVHSDQLQGKSLPVLLHDIDPENGTNLAKIICNCCEQGKLIEIPAESLLVLPNKQIRHLSGSCSPIRTADGVLQGAVLVCHDVTDKRNMQDMLTQSRKMEAIGQLAGGVAHDFNNLLTGISGFAELLTLQLKEGSQEKKNALKILNAATRAADLTSKLLSFARKGKVMSSPVNCHQVLQSSFDLLQHSIDKSIEMHSRFDAENSVIICDPMQLENVFLNLAINSADSMPDGGQLTISTINVEIHEPLQCEFGETLTPGEYLQISIKDTGCGIDTDLRQKIFEPFFTTKAQGKGTGLGLAAVFGAIQEHGSHIQLNSEVGVGTEFILYFALERHRQPEVPSPHTFLNGDGATILVIDDETLILSSAKGLLSQLGYNVLVADGGAAGIDLYRRHHGEIDLVIVDMIMPDMNGTTCFKELQKINADIKVIISSGFTKTSRFTEAEELGVLGFLQKPYSASEVNSSIHHILHPEQN